MQYLWTIILEENTISIILYYFVLITLHTFSVCTLSSLWWSWLYSFVFISIINIIISIMTIYKSCQLNGAYLLLWSSSSSPLFIAIGVDGCIHCMYVSKFANKIVNICTKSILRLVLLIVFKLEKFGAIFYKSLHGYNECTVFTVL